VAAGRTGTLSVVATTTTWPCIVAATHTHHNLKLKT